jgi:hypothetical protein
MMKKSISVLGLVFLVLTIAFVSSLEVKKADIVVKTKPYHYVTIKIIDPDEDSTIQTIKNKTQTNGEYRFTYYSVKDEISLEISVKNESRKLAEESFGPFTVTEGEEIYAEIEIDEVIEELEEDVSQDLVETKNSESGEQENLVATTGRVVKSNEGKESSTVFYIIAIAFFASAIFVFIFKRRRIMKFPPHELKNVDDVNSVHKKDDEKRDNEVKIDKDYDGMNKDEKISETEKKIKELQSSLDELKNKEKIETIEENIRREKEEVEKLRKG